MVKDSIELEINKHGLDNNMDATVGILKNIANRNIVSNSHALLELIKNSFDEDSSNVLVIFIYQNERVTEIRIIDEGNGFTEEGFNSFRLIGKSQKIPNTKTPLGRIITGMYGSGAYSSIKLGNYLKINSVNYEKNFSFCKEIDWSFIYKNPNKSIRELSFQDLNQSNHSMISGTQFIIKDINSGFNLPKIISDLLYITIRSDFSVRFAFSGRWKDTINFIQRLDNLKNFSFVKNETISFSYLNGEIKVDLKIKDKKESWIIDSTVVDFQGLIKGEYLSIDKKLFNKSKSQFSETPLFKGREAFNLFYNNEMLVLTDELLGLDLRPMSIREKYNLGFSNPLGYTAIQETHLIFNESRTSITDDPNGQYQKYKIILGEIFDNIVKKIKNILNLSNINSKNNLLSLNTIGNHSISTLRINPTSIKEELSLELKNTKSILNNANPYYKELIYCIDELIRIISLKNYMTDYNISFYAVIRVYCEILFIYKIYNFFNNNKNDLNKVIKIFQKKTSSGFGSIGNLMKLLSSNNDQLIQQLSDDFSEKTNEKKLDNVINLVREINKHIHKPSSGIKESIAYDLIRIFTKWL
ncbi:ATP-binding protein [Spiroplasma attinicola]|uniref:ATP-binding protein n=1 Tax=Spiroplasma attinicola TaxID=2904537 RepID=UPI002022A131|nr:ATP-binding protein [Spiroplasma sp. JKS002670]MCL8209782.1 hypothetical protein [Spiroplasma sp. JKS002670]